MKYWVVIEKSPRNYSAYVPDLPGCVATGDTQADVEREIHDAIEFHLAGMVADNDPIPEPWSYAREVDVRMPRGREQHQGQLAPCCWQQRPGASPFTQQRALRETHRSGARLRRARVVRHP